MSAYWRLFVAVDLNTATRAAIATAQAAARQAGYRARWVAPAQAHLTLLFLGQQPAALVPALCQALQEATATITPFTLHTAACGSFPRPQRPRVLWLGLGGAVDALEQLQAAVVTAAASVGVANETQSFRPHLTLGRLGQMASASTGDFAALQAATGQLRAALPVTAVQLVRSELGQGRPRYTVLCRATLCGGHQAPAAGNLCRASSVNWE